jgi:hypothetical protein
MSDSGDASFTSAVRPVLRAVVETVVPEATALGEAGWRELEAIVEEAVAGRPASVRRQLGALLVLIENAAGVRYGRRFSQLDPLRRTRFLESLQDGPVLLLRRGVWGLRTLALMGYYARPAAAAEIGYTPTSHGWEALATLDRRAPSSPGAHEAAP